MHGILKNLTPRSAEAEERLRELFGWAGRRKPITFWYAGAGYDISPFLRITNYYINYDFDPHIPEAQKYKPEIEEPELFIYTDAMFPYYNDHQLRVQRDILQSINAYGEFSCSNNEIIKIHELYLEEDSCLLNENTCYRYFNNELEFYNNDFDDGQKLLNNAFLVDIIVKDKMKKYSILFWRIGNMKFLKDVALAQNIKLDYVLITNLGAGGRPIQGAHILSSLGAIKSNYLFACQTNLYKINDEHGGLSYEEYIEDRMIFISSSKNVFNDYNFNFKGNWFLGNSNALAFKIQHLDNVLTYKRQEEIRLNMLDYRLW